jgi:hypothetical protein
MHNDTPLGMTMHLRELDRRAAPQLHPARATTRHTSSVIAVRAAMITLLRRIHAMGARERVENQG